MIAELARICGPEAQKPLRANLVGLCIEGALSGVCFALLVPILRALLEGDLAATGAWFGAFVVTAGGYALLCFRNQLLGYRAAIGIGRTLFERLGAHIVVLPLGWFAKDRTGMLTHLTSQGVIDVMSAPAHLLRPLIMAVVTPATVTLLMFLFDWRLALAALVTAPFAVLAMRVTGRVVESKDHLVRAANEKAAGRIVEFAQAQAVLRAFDCNKQSFAKLNDAIDRQYAAGRDLLLSAAGGQIGFVVILQLAFTGVLLFGVNLALGGAIDSAELVALLVLFARYLEPLLGAAELEGALLMSRNSIAKIDGLLKVAPLPEADGGKAAVRGASVCFDEVAFSYGDTPLLRHLSFTVPERSMTAIVGLSGSGKTTILRLVARFFDVQAGAVRVGGADVRDLTTKELMDQISIVFQDVHLFEGSIADNIRFGRLDATSEEVMAAARLARVDEVAERLADGFDANVGEGGTILSGGERQRVSIARAILKNAPIILLDEATASLDPVNEAAIQFGLHSLTKDKTLLVVAHRLQTVRAADQILFLADGAVVECGDHETLISLNGKYADFWRSRRCAAGWTLTPQGVIDEEVDEKEKARSQCDTN